MIFNWSISVLFFNLPDNFLTGAILGSIFGGVVILVFKLTGRGIMIFSTISACLAATFYGTSLYFTCGTVTMVGITQPYPTDVGFYDSGEFLLKKDAYVI